MAIRTKVLLAIMLAVILSIIGVTITVSREMNKAFINNFTVGSKAQLDRMNSFVGTFFDSAVSSVNYLVSSPLVTENIHDLTAYVDTKEPYKPLGVNLPPKERALYEEMMRMTKAFPSYFLVYANNNAGGITQAPDDTLSAGFNPAKRPWYIAAVNAGKAIITEAYISDSGEAVCTIAAPVPDTAGKGFAGVVAIDISLKTLTTETGNVAVGKTGYVLLLDSLNQVISDPKNSGPEKPEKERWLGKTVNDIPGDAGRALTALVARNQQNMEVSFDGKDWLASVSKTPEGWTLIMLQERAEVFANAMSVTLSILLIGLVIAAIMLGIALFVSRSIARPVVILAGASQKVAEGDLDAIPENTGLFKGELAILHVSLKQMVSKLAELIGTAESKIREAEDALGLSRKSMEEAEEARKQADIARKEGIYQAAERIGTVIEQLSQATVRLSAEARHTEERTGEQRERVSGTVSAIVQMNGAVSEIAASTSRTAHLAEEAQQEAENGKKLVLEVVSSMGEIERQSNAMKESLTALGAHSHDIGQIMGVINDIADQTNLLALNAAIEAARAGEAGRGFAVVADEVRKLAEKTMEATKQVAGAVQTIQHSTSDNISGMEKNTEYVGTSMQVAQQAGDALAGIADRVEHTAAEVRSIATASEEQSATLEAINRSTNEINDISAEVADGARQSNEAVEELTRLSNQLASIVEELKKE